MVPNVYDLLAVIVSIEFTNNKNFGNQCTSTSSLLCDQLDTSTPSGFIPPGTDCGIIGPFTKSSGTSSALLRMLVA
jgi:hypothetical protein